MFSKILGIAEKTIKWSFIVGMSACINMGYFVGMAFYTGDLVGWATTIHIVGGLMIASFSLMAILWVFFGLSMMWITRKGA